MMSALTFLWNNVRQGVLVAVGCLALSGCLCCRDRCLPVSGECVEGCEAAPRSGRDSVYVFLVNGFDPFNVTKLGDVRASLQRLGFTRVYCGQFYHADFFVTELTELTEREPNARFVVVGVGAGVETAKLIVDCVADDGVTIDLLASVDSPSWSGASGEHPANVQRVLALHGKPTWLAPTPSAGEDVVIDLDNWFGISGDPLTVEKLGEELAAITQTVPTPIRQSINANEDQPVTPRPQSVRRSSPRDEWDFLNPVEKLSDVTPGAQPISVRETAARGSSR